MIRIGVDVGGTRVRVAAVDAHGRIVRRCVFPTSDVCRGRDPLAGIICQIEKLLAHPAVSQDGTNVAAGPRAGSGMPEGPRSSAATGGGRDVHTASKGGRCSETETALRESQRECCEGVEAIGLALPATLDERRRSVMRCVHVPELEGRRPASEVRRRMGVPCGLFTDIESATWAEYLHGEPMPDRFIHLRVGTGVGVGVVIDGRIHRLDAGRMTHLPALVVEDGPNARPCPCGLTGCLERYGSGAALTETIEAQGIGQQVADLQAAWDRGENAARVLLASSADSLARALQNLTTLFRPDSINLGGGVISRLPALLEQVRLRFRAVTDDASVSRRVVIAHHVPDDPCDPTKKLQTMGTDIPTRPRIESSALGDDAGVIGAAVLARRSMRTD